MKSDFFVFCRRWKLNFFDRIRSDWIESAETVMHELRACRCISVNISEAVKVFQLSHKSEMGKQGTLQFSYVISFMKTIFFFAYPPRYQLLKSSLFFLVTRLVNSIETDIVVLWNIVNVVQRRAANGDIFEIECVSVTLLNWWFEVHWDTFFWCFYFFSLDCCELFFRVKIVLFSVIKIDVMQWKSGREMLSISFQNKHKVWQTSVSVLELAAFLWASLTYLKNTSIKCYMRNMQMKIFHRNISIRKTCIDSWYLQ